MSTENTPPPHFDQIMIRRHKQEFTVLIKGKFSLVVTCILVIVIFAIRHMQI